MQPSTRHLRLVAAAAGVALLATGCTGATPRAAASLPSPPPPVASPEASPAAPAPWNDPATANNPAGLAVGSNPSALPGPLMIADKLNNRVVIVDPQGRVRWQFPRPGDLAPGQTFKIPDDAFFTPDGRQIIATEEDAFVVSVIDIATHRIVYRYGMPGHAGSGPNQLDNPDDALMLPNGDILAADIKNCRIVLIAPQGTSPARIYGRTMRSCLHAPPSRFGSPNGAFPMSNGHYLVTEINGQWVDEMGIDGAIAWSVRLPGVAYPSDSNEIGPDRYLTVDYSSPGQALIFDRTGHVVWRYRPAGAGRLSHPSLALPLPNGDVIVNDDYNHRVVVIDPRTSRVVWQYGHTGRASAAAGYLNNPDGMDFAPPYSLLGTHAATMGQP